MNSSRKTKQEKKFAKKKQKQTLFVPSRNYDLRPAFAPNAR
jgi:hypothetical protein